MQANQNSPKLSLAAKLTFSFHTLTSSEEIAGAKLMKMVEEALSQKPWQTRGGKSLTTYIPSYKGVIPLAPNTRRGTNEQAIVLNLGQQHRASNIYALQKYAAVLGEFLANLQMPGSEELFAVHVTLDVVCWTMHSTPFSERGQIRD
ncbi:MAG: hypothetical protein ABIT47_01630 [Candidatus Paceibacterota bacterium]